MTLFGAVGKILLILFVYVGLVAWTERRERALSVKGDAHHGVGVVGKKGRRQGRVA